MTRRGWTQFKKATISVAAVFAMAAPVLAQAQQNGSLPPGTVSSTAGINPATDIKFDQRLDNQIELSNTFRDESGATVPLSKYFDGKKPVVLVMPFYKCPGVCSAMLDGMVNSFSDPKNKFKIGRDFQAVTVSINPKEDAALATAKKKEYLSLLGIPGAENGWHFLTGDEANIRKLADEIGYIYKYNVATDNYAHASGIVVITPNGRVSHCFYGVEYPAGQMKLALTEAGEGKIGTPVDQIILACYHTDPSTGRYGPAIFKIIQIACFSTVFLLGLFIVPAFLKDAKAAKFVPTDGAKAAVEEDKA